MREQVIKAAVLTATLGALALGACDDDGGGSTPGLALHLYGPSGAHDPFAGVGWIRVQVVGDGLAGRMAAEVEGAHFATQGDLGKRGV